ncbi:hypothetical protein SLEP1_g28601 [Rubroshorea leprosula]|uniref:(+)-delta-cadinene synthase n=1 Tax=Rubroshorea leprosula TaxID=152421 RepID=A0AAV5K3X2_9ROSI|nr:hypothetical protein SLEP1_g28601 [Rubroshorea leprosula]
MSSQVLVTNLISLQDASSKNNRPSSASYHPSLWRDHFIKHSLDFTEIDATAQQEYEDLKHEVRTMLDDSTCDHSTKLRSINAVQLLGIDYHFEREIEDALQRIYHDGDTCYDLSTVALWFRLLRQQGINVSSEVFKKFMDMDGKFKVDLVNDVPGLLSLYEAAHLGLQGEEILDEALVFTTSNLQSIVTQIEISPLLVEQVTHALNQPLWKGLPRIEARHYISLYSRDDHFASSCGTLLKFAKLDFNMLQSFHQKELCNIMEWWKKLDFTTKLPYARDRLMECYFWVIAIYFEPKYSFARIFLTKLVAILSVLDDTYDNYGTYEDLKLFTKCIERWDINVIDQLPECMKLVYEALLNLYSEIDEEVAKEQKLYAIRYAKESMKKNVRAYLLEAKWREEGYVPSVEEYMTTAVISSCVPNIMVNSFIGMGKVASEEAFAWIFNDPKMLVSCAIIGRLLDDIVSHEFEQHRDHVASAVECYMKQHGVSREETVESFRKEIAKTWKVFNEEWVKPTVFPMPLLARILNFARSMEVIYKNGDGFTMSYLLKDHVTSLLVDPVFI